MALPKFNIAGMSVKDYAYLWINGHCPLHQWCSGARGIDDEVIEYCKKELAMIKASVDSIDGFEYDGWNEDDVLQFSELVKYLEENKGAPAEPYGI